MRSRRYRLFSCRTRALERCELASRTELAPFAPRQRIEGLYGAKRSALSLPLIQAPVKERPKYLRILGGVNC